eukprot:342002-Hanusia_phi.AAC.1
MGGGGQEIHMQKATANSPIQVEDGTNMSTSGYYFVYKCRVQVGIKERKGVVKAAKDATSEKMLQQELENYKKLHRNTDAHKYVVDVLFFENWSGDGSREYLSLVFERAKQSLAEWIVDTELDERQNFKVGVAQQLGRIVSFVHQQHLVWLDIKPANFLIFKGLKIKATDFDGARKTGTAVTHKTVAYCAPELLRTGEVTAKYEMDAWSLGMTLFEVFTGEHLYSLELGCRSDEQIERFWSTEGSEETLRSKASQQLTSSLSDENLKHVLFGRDGNGGVLRANPRRRSFVLQCMQERALFTDKGTT